MGGRGGGQRGMSLYSYACVCVCLKRLGGLKRKQKIRKRRSGVQMHGSVCVESLYTGTDPSGPGGGGEGRGGLLL